MHRQNLLPLACVAAALVVSCTAQAQTTGALPTAERRAYIVELKDPPAATYTGGVSGLAPTRPAAGQRLDVSAASVQSYLAYIDRQVSAVAASVPAATVHQRYGIVFNGFATKLTPAEVNKLSAHPSVRAITADQPMKLDTVSTTSQFLGLGLPGGAWSRLDAVGRPLKGEDVIVGIVDSGIWPENLAFSDRVDAAGRPAPAGTGSLAYNPLPAGRYRGSCNAAPGFQPSLCNHKLVGAQAFDAGFRQQGHRFWPSEYPSSPRDEDGHGSHVASTAAGNADTPITLDGGLLSTTGVAPRARVAAYKVCWSFADSAGQRANTCITGDIIAAINKAVADGVDVINMSISGSQQSVVDAVNVAFFNANAAGVFVVTSAGNQGPGNAVAHVGPWNLTVANTTHDRAFDTTLSLGSGATARGTGFVPAGLPSRPLILSFDAGVTPFDQLTSDADRLALARCYGAGDRASFGGTAAAALDPAKVRGKLLVCLRGGNLLVSKSASARAAGAAGMVLQNVAGGFFASANTTPAAPHTLPTVHLDNSHEALVLGYARLAGASGALQPSVASEVLAPVMNVQSSRGPNRADGNVLKPDLTAPGTDIIASYVPPDMSFAERDAIVAGTASGRQGATFLSGTSMASPHVAGMGALLRQLRPTWSPAALRSAVLTSAEPEVKLADGRADTDRWGYGAGHLAPAGALDTQVVFETQPSQLLAWASGSLGGHQINLPSLSRSDFIGSETFTRTLTNRGTQTVTLTGEAALPGFEVRITPARLTLAPGASAAVTVRVDHQGAPLGRWVFGDIVWSGSGQRLRSPLSILPRGLVASTGLSDTRATGSRVFTVGTGYDGVLLLSTSALVPAQATTTRVATGQQVCGPLDVPPGAAGLQAQLFDAETEGGVATDLDLVIYGPTGAVAGASGGPTSSELVSLPRPGAGRYMVCVEGYRTAQGTAEFTLSTWVVPGSGGTEATLRATGPAMAYRGRSATVAASWTTSRPARYLGYVDYRQVAGGPSLGTTTLSLDTRTTSTTQQAPLLEQKPPR